MIRLVQPHGNIEFRTFENSDGQAMVSVLIPDGASSELTDVHFRLHDFVAFTDYAVGVMDDLLRDQGRKRRG